MVELNLDGPPLVPHGSRRVQQIAAVTSACIPSIIRPIDPMVLQVWGLMTPGPGAGQNVGPQIGTIRWGAKERSKSQYVTPDLRSRRELSDTTEDRERDQG